MITRTTKITIETDGMLVVRQGRTVVTWCPECNAEVETMLCDDAFLAQLLAGIMPARCTCGGRRTARPRSAFRPCCSFPNPAKFTNPTF